MTALRQKMIDQMTLRGFAPKTHEAYLHAVSGLASYYRTPPDRLTNAQIQAYLVYLLSERKLAWSSVNVATQGIRFFYHRTLGWDRMRLEIPPRKRPTRLPEVLSTAEVRRVLDAVTNPKHHALLATTYAAGLRVGEVVRLRVADVDSERNVLRIGQSKGRKDRHTALSDHLLEELRTYYRACRPRQWLFFGGDRSRPLNVSSAQRVYAQARRRAGVTRGAGIHTLRHSFATHLLEAGVDVRRIQEMMGHTSIVTTMGYLRVRRSHLVATPSLLALLPVEPEAPSEEPTAP